MIHLQQASNAPVVHPIYVHLHRLLPHLIRVASLLRLRRVATFAMLTPIALTSALRQPGFDLACVSLTIRTCVHFSTLLRVHSFHHSPSLVGVSSFVGI